MKILKKFFLSLTIIFVILLLGKLALPGLGSFLVADDEPQHSEVLEMMGEITTMKLQKLVYYAQAWSLVWDEQELFDEEFQAWANGPVCPELFYEHKGLYRINAEQLTKGDSSLLNNTQKETIDAVLDYYGDKPAHWLSMLTHREQPWIDARRGIPVGANCENIITKDSMMLYYDSLKN